MAHWEIEQATVKQWWVFASPLCVLNMSPQLPGWHALDPLSGLFVKTTQILVLHAPRGPPLSGCVLRRHQSMPHWIHPTLSALCLPSSWMLLLCSSCWKGDPRTYVNRSCDQNYLCHDIPELPELFTAMLLLCNGIPIFVTLSCFACSRQSSSEQHSNTQACSMRCFLCYSVNNTGH